MPTDEPLAQVARELYALVPGAFVAARNARAARLRQAGERDLAAEVKRLPKASVAAWVVSAVVRAAGEDVDALGELGAELRVAQRLADPTELRALSRRRRERVAALTRTAARVAAEHDVELSAAVREQVADTWQAVVIDPVAERTARSGLLARALAPGDEDPRAALAVPDAVEGPRAQDRDDGRGLRLVPATPPATEEDTEDAAEEDADGAAEEDAEDAAEDEEADDAAEAEVADDVPEEDAPPGEAREESHVRGGIRIRRPAPGRGAPGGDRRRPASRSGAHRGQDSVDAPGASGTSRDRTGTAPRAGADGADAPRETRRLRRELRSRERFLAGAQEELEEASEELRRVEAQVLQAAARLEELRREAVEVEQRLEELDEARVAAAEEREDAEERSREAQQQVAQVRARLAELDEE